MRDRHFERLSSATWRLAVALLLASSVVWAQGDEAAPRLRAADVLPAATLKGAHHAVADGVLTESYFHEFTITSPYGTFHAAGRSQVPVRVLEVEALAALDDVSKTEVFLSAAGRSVVNVGKGAASVVTDPAGTAKGFGAGVKRFGVNLGRRTERALDKDEGEDDASASSEQGKDSATEAAMKSALGVTSAMRRWAQKLNVDPYTTNAALRKALEEVGKVDTAGSIAAKVAVPVPAAVGLTAGVGGLVWGKDPEELRKINEQRLREMGVSDEIAKRLFRSRAFTLTYQTRLVAALHAVRAPGCADYVESAAGARSEREALFFVESTELLQGLAARERVARLLPDSRALVAATGTRAIALLPLDWVRWTAGTNTVARQLADRARRELGATELRFALTGTATPRMTAALSEAGWSVVKAESEER